MESQAARYCGHNANMDNKKSECLRIRTFFGGGLLQLFGPRRGRNLGRGEFTLAVAVAACHGDHRRVAGREPELRQEGALFRGGVDEHQSGELRVLRIDDFEARGLNRVDQFVSTRGRVERILDVLAVAAHQVDLRVAALAARRQVADFGQRPACDDRKFYVCAQLADIKPLVRFGQRGVEHGVVDPVEHAVFLRIGEKDEGVALDRVLFKSARRFGLLVGQGRRGDAGSLGEIDDQGYVARRGCGLGSLLADGDGFHPVDARGRDRDAAEPLLFAVRTGCRGGYADGRVARVFGPVEREAPAGCHGLPGGGRRDGEGFRGAGFGAQQDVGRADRQRRRVFVVVAAAGGHGKGGRQQQQACEGPRESECLHKIIFL